MGVLAVYDTVGIQNYIFASNKLAENVGGSKLVEDIFANLLKDVIITVTGETLPDWQAGGELNPALKAEIVYQGGGNAFVVFQDEPIFQAVTEAFLVRVSQDAPGVGIAAAAIETDFGAASDTDFKKDFEKLNKRLLAVKGGFNIPAFAGNQPITKQSQRTGLPVSAYMNNEYLSVSQVKKRERYAGYKEKRGSAIKNFSDLAFEKGTDSLIAIIHADGNNMGKHIKEFMEHFKTYDEAVPKIRELAVKIDDCYKSALERTVEEFKTAYAAYIAEQRDLFPDKYRNTKEKNYDEPPYLELIGAGDDITIVISGKFALDFAARLLREIEATPPDKRPFAEFKPELKPTACAGVVLFHDHYPFSESYKLAEALCSSAKKPSRVSDGSYIDFHLHQSGNVSSLRDLRERRYKVDGKTLLCRPWRVSERVSEEGGDNFPEFSWFEKNAAKFQDPESFPRNKKNAAKLQNTKSFPRNKTKAIRNAISAGETASEIAIKNMRGEKLPKCSFKVPQELSKYAPYFDILEMADAYVNLLNKEAENNVE